MIDDLAQLDRPADERTQPWDRIAEQSAVGGMLLSTQAVWDVVDEVTPGDFYDPRHELIARAVVRLAQAHHPTDVVAVTEELTRSGELRRAGGAEYLHELTSIVPTAANAGYYAEIVRAKAIMRRLVAAGTRVVQMGYASEGNPLELVESARAEVDRVVSSATTGVEAVGEGIEAFIESLEQEPDFTPTPWTDLNALIGGLRPGKLYVIGARPASGKTLVATQLAVELARRVGPVAFSSLEMSRDEIRKRLFSQLGSIPLGRLVDNKLTQEDWSVMPSLVSAIRDAPIFVDDTSGVGLTQIQAHARSVSRKGKLAGIVVDYLQLMQSGDERRENRATVVAGFSRGLKVIAQNMNVPVIALSQLNRESEGTKGGRPTMAQLRESGAIEQDADVVILLHREPENPKTKDRLKLHVAKNRHGDVGDLELEWQGHFARVRDVNTLWTPTSVLNERRDLA